jgi:hypothetical protein
MIEIYILGADRLDALPFLMRDALTTIGMATMPPRSTKDEGYLQAHMRIRGSHMIDDYARCGIRLAKNFGDVG